MSQAGSAVLIEAKWEPESLAKDLTHTLQDNQTEWIATARTFRDPPFSQL